jgi:hypothetical protein
MSPVHDDDDANTDGGWSVETMRSLKRSSARAAAKINNQVWSLDDLTSHDDHVCHITDA